MNERMLPKFVNNGMSLFWSLIQQMTRSRRHDDGIGSGGGGAPQTE